MDEGESASATQLGQRPGRRHKQQRNGSQITERPHSTEHFTDLGLLGPGLLLEEEINFLFKATVFLESFCFGSLVYTHILDLASKLESCSREMQINYI